MSSKRKFSETDFCDDSDGYAYGDRKKKRGEIEKKRRDRINDCLNQLKELVPTACEKSNVNKLEKRYPGGSFDVEKSEHRRVGDR